MKLKTFNNNLRLCVNTKKDTKTISFNIFVNVGSMHEGKKEYGYSHFAEHMFFKSTQEVSSQQIHQTLDELGASENAYTSHSHTCYYFSTLSACFEQCLQLYSDMFFNTKYNKQELEKEKLVILEEYKMQQDKDSRVAVNNAYSSLFYNTCLDHKILGDVATIKAVTPLKLANFKKRHYTPNNVVISISGDISFSRAKKLVNKYFVQRFDGNKQDIRNQLIKCVASPKQKYILVQKDKKQAAVTILFALNDHDNLKEKAYRILFLILGAGMSSKLFKKIREELGLVYHIGAGNFQASGTNVAEIAFATAPKNVLTALIEIKKILYELADGNINEQDLIKAKNHIIAGLEFSNEINAEIAEDSGKMILKHNRIITNKEYLLQINKIKISNIIQCAKELIDSTYVVSCVGSCKKQDLKAF